MHVLHSVRAMLITIAILIALAAPAVLQGQEFAQLQKRAAGGDARAQVLLGHAYRLGRGVQKDPQQAMYWYRKAADQGDAAGQNNVGIMYVRGLGVPRDYREAVRWYALAAKQNYPPALANLAWAYEYGQGVPQDYARALQLYRMAAAKGYASAMNSVGVMYGKGKGVPRNDVIAVEWFRKAAEAGNVAAQSNLAIGFATGSGVPQNYTEALNWARKASEHNDARAWNTLGVLYANGYGVAKDRPEALRCWRKAAQLGDAAAQKSLALAYERGHGVAVDRAEALAWFQFAAQQGDPEARQGVARLRGAGVTPRQVEVAVAAAPALGSAPEVEDEADFAHELRTSTVAVENVDSAPATGARSPHAYALIVGAEKYRAPIPEVPFAIRDAAVMKRYFEATLGIPAEHIKGVDNPQLTDLIVGVEWLRNQVKADASPDAVAYVYYAGHGVPEAASGKPYLLPVDAKTDYIGKTGYALDALMTELSALTGRSVVLLDACFTGTAARSAGTSAGLTGGKRPAYIDTQMPLPRGGKVFLLSAVSSKQTSNALTGASHGLFTYFLLKGLRGEAADPKGRITLQDLYGYVQKEVSSAATRMNQEQTPTLTGPDTTLVIVPAH